MKNEILSARALTWFAAYRDPLIGMPVLVYVTLVIILVLCLLCAIRPLGALSWRRSNESAVRLAGINVTKYKFIAYVISGHCCRRRHHCHRTQRTGFTAECRAERFCPVHRCSLCHRRCVALEGGKGTVPFTVVGVLILALITNVMNLAGLASYPQYVVKAPL